ncbi:1,2-dihydroxy-3-keto-5-methylthiopentene dioxygenase [Alloalcanivorax xenomutans]|jgi:1,2-dihydroxy-3-keto-5-methylthiopentene dioxygenase|uniref:1,2-dihydroxy-3-keto-5-methylthiopentene dioxygenase n=1 Tax=Alloalcanivorax xenomutans TaxID=1094342 RepID=UPI0003B90C6A|nr:cupin domain-containing protein [Alloalcanivorax xenomutans]ERS13112.1 acireductone dioxygenase [Alcanivorax sp. PN-3]MBA4720255.1 cupin domain-containing protein [Alcanivorax sp.]ARB45820.1 cupin [Alloalcanivorax xenomutans]MCE7523839.1 cupin domain-containing protein [Alloalcanivorax xenomutans]SOB97580.1 1,2-dihydroxy-3-keto-5-methylthiopentene dioxygenase [Alloalcanivorax xenomutans]|tara:strand:+ start:1169 stop:1714 length:546 start_codon:yes stop_codon:yes gene_type:complete
MSNLKIFRDGEPDNPQLVVDSKAAMAVELAKVGIRYEQWEATKPLTASPSQEEVLEAYAEDIDRLKREEGYQTVDVVSMQPDHPDKAAFREKFLDEHRHSEDEVRFFVEGQGLFTLHIEDQVYEVLCTKGDLISVPANTAHWFDMGPNPHFVAIRLFNNPEGWVANFTGSDIAGRFSRLEN